jgi:circadian clock protein KaiC
MRVATGIEGFDNLVQGGFPAGKQILLTGSPGTGKTIFSLEYLHNGAHLFGEKGLYVSFEESVEDLKEQAKQFGWNFDELEQQQKAWILAIPATEISESTLGEITSLIQRNGIKRLVVDSLTSLAINIPSSRTSIGDLTDIFIRRFIYQFIFQLRELKDVTTLLVAQAADKGITLDGVSEFVCDGIIKIDYESLGGAYSRSLSIRKMRQVKNEEDVHPLEITNVGLVVHSLD